MAVACSGFNVINVKTGNIRYVLSLMIKETRKEKLNTYVPNAA